MFFVIISDFPKLFCATGSKMFKGDIFHEAKIVSNLGRG